MLRNKKIDLKDKATGVAPRKISEKIKEIIHFIGTNLYVIFLLIASVLLFLNFILSYKEIISTIALYQVPIVFICLYYCVGLNVIWYILLMLYTKKVKLCSLIELGIISLLIFSSLSIKIGDLFYSDKIMHLFLNQWIESLRLTLFFVGGMLLLVIVSLIYSSIKQRKKETSDEKVI